MLFFGSSTRISGPKLLNKYRKQLTTVYLYAVYNYCFHSFINLFIFLFICCYKNKLLKHIRNAFASPTKHYSSRLPQCCVLRFVSTNQLIVFFYFYLFWGVGGRENELRWHANDISFSFTNICVTTFYHQALCSSSYLLVYFCLALKFIHSSMKWRFPTKNNHHILPALLLLIYLLFHAQIHLSIHLLLSKPNQLF